MQQDKKYYDNFFAKYPIDIHDNPDRFNAVSALLSGKVLDVACGTGTLSKYYAGDYVGIDISDVAINKAKAVRRKNAIFIVGDAQKIKSVSSVPSDSIYIGEFLEHIENDDILFSRLLLLLREGGKIVVTVPNGDRVPDESHCRTFTVPQIRRDYSKYGKIVFHNWSGFQNRILFTIEPDKKNEDNMSLVMVVKDEQKGIERAILSALSIVDRVVVSVDTKTSDKTAEIAKLYADELKFHEWKDDFSGARNFASENVKSKWILFLDGHEYIESYGDFAEKMQFDVDGIFITVRMESGMTFLYPRIYRSYLKFKNKVHNLIECKTRRCAPTFVIVHDRVGGQDEDAIKRREEQREKMLPEAMKQQLKENPKNARASFHLANFYMMRHDTDLAMKYYKKAIKYGKSPDEKYMSLLHYGALHSMKKHDFRALWNFKKANELMPDRWESARVLGGFYLMQKDYKKAVDYFVHALTPNKCRYAYQPMQQSFPEIWDLIGHCFAKLDQNAQARIAWMRAKELATDETKKKFYQQKIELVSSLLPHKIPVKDEGGSGEERPSGVQGQSPC